MLKRRLGTGDLRLTEVDGKRTVGFERKRRTCSRTRGERKGNRAMEWRRVVDGLRTEQVGRRFEYCQIRGKQIGRSWTLHAHAPRYAYHREPTGLTYIVQTVVVYPTTWPSGGGKPTPSSRVIFSRPYGTCKHLYIKYLSKWRARRNNRPFIAGPL